ncbi:MAG TPA: solute carrier family 23 protein [Propioniciclava sp.]|jgi:uracil-xanthine permease|uniref:uracil-xanthine permease family protein n=1 Tax=Propioniciclava sp. TaxID=2038686 RepID=UPI002C417D5E|nr:solute carrier family 23 protein [Propioniciclava sp.]HRL50490.1 solute carrier family 23 protein [Propioniciclava sp.]HRL79660.1 solute carrier family 23 protein [Propioniciclava sp.]
MALWKLHGDGSLKLGEVVAPHERLSWGKTIGLGAQHVVAMFGATFVFPLLMGLNPQLAVMMSGIATLVFLLVVKGKVPSYLGSSASFVGVATAIYSAGGNPSDLTGAMFWVGVLLLIVGLIISAVGAKVIHRALPPVVTGGVVMLIGFNLAPVVANTYWPQDQWVALVTMLLVVVLSVGVKGFIGRIAIFVSLIFGYVLSWLLDVLTGPITAFSSSAGEVTTHLRVDWSGVADAAWLGLPPVTNLSTWQWHADTNVVGFHLPHFNMAFALIALPVVIALIAENTGHVKAVAEMTGENLDKQMGPAIAADGATSMLATLAGAGPTTTYAENIGVMASTRVYSSAAYVVAALVAILFGFSPKFGAIISATPGGVLGGITVVLYGMIGLLGAKIWKENQVDFGNPVNLVPVAAGIIIGVGDVSLNFGNWQLSGIAFGTLVTVIVYHLAHRLAPAELKDNPEGAVLIVDRPGAYKGDPED